MIKRFGWIVAAAILLGSVIPGWSASNNFSGRSGSSGGGAAPSGSAGDIQTYGSSMTLAHITPGTGVAVALANAVGGTGGFALQSGLAGKMGTGGELSASAAFAAIMSVGSPNSGSLPLGIGAGTGTATNKYPLFLGIKAGSNFPIGGNWTTAIGGYAAHFLTTGAELTALGNLACLNVTTGSSIACLGLHSVGSETTATQIAAVGNDAMRDTIGETGGTAVGARALRDGVGNSDTAIGALAMEANAGSVVFTGSATAGDVASCTFSSTNPNVIIASPTASYTVQGGDTLAIVRDGLVTAISNLQITATDTDGNNEFTTYGMALNAFAQGITTNVVALGLEFPGSQTIGWAITPVCSATGAATEIFTIKNAYSGNSNVALGFKSMLGVTMTTAQENVAVGTLTLPNMQTGNYNVALGSNSLNAETIGSDNVALGGYSGNAQAGASDNTLVGFKAGLGITTGHDNVVLGSKNTNASDITTGSSNITIGSGAAVPVATASNQLNINNVIAGPMGSTSASVCAVGMQCVLGSLASANFNSTADQSIIIRALSSNQAGYLSRASKYLITAIVVANCSTSLTTALGGFYTAASKGGTIIGAVSTSYTNCVSATTQQRLTSITNMDTSTFTATTLRLSLTTAQGVAATGDVYIIGIPLN